MVNAKAIDRWYSEMPREEEMLPKDKYTMFDRKERSYRKGIHSRWLTCRESRRESRRALCLRLLCRITQMDPGQSARQPTRLLKVWAYKWLHGVWDLGSDI